MYFTAQPAARMREALARSRERRRKRRQAREAARLATLAAKPAMRPHAEKAAAATKPQFTKPSSRGGGAAAEMLPDTSLLPDRHDS
jgi:hypothetical protein